MSVATGAVGDHVQTHVVGVYDRDPELIPAIVAFLAEALDHDGIAIVVATPSHRGALDDALAASGHAIAALTEAGRYRAFDAREMLTSFMRDRHPDPEAFASTTARLVGSAAERGRPVRVFGEMVALLWDDGNIAGALDLESLWNRLAKVHHFAVFCAYALSSLERSGDLAAAKGMCEHHSEVVALPAPVPAGRHRADDPYERLFLATTTAPHEVRAFVRSALDGWHEPRHDGELEIIASELATNAVRHARSPFRVTVTRTPSAVRVAVRDASGERPEHLVHDHDVNGGRGVRLVAALSSAWGTDDERDGKTVWAEVPRASLS